MSTLFVSYSRKDSPMVYAIANKLRGLNYTVWTDITGIAGGTVWHKEIEQALTVCDAVLVMVSSASKESDWVRKEILYALDLKKTIIPVRLERIAMPFSLIDLQPIDYIVDPDTAFTALVAVLPATAQPSSSPKAVLEAPNVARLQGASLVSFRRNLFQQE